MSKAGSPEAAECPPAAAPAEAKAPAAAPTPAEFDFNEHAFSARDLIAFDRVGDPQVSPDGKRVVFVVRSTDTAANRGRTDLWITSVDGGKPLTLAEHPEADMSPRWGARGGEVFFLSRRSGSSQIWVVDADGGEPRQVTKVPVDIGSFLVSPDGEHLAFSAEVYPTCEDLECSAHRIAEAKARKSTGMVHDRLFARHWDTWKGELRSHLFVVPIKGGPAVDVTAGLDADVPSKPFGGDEEIAFTPDGGHLVYTARVAGREEPWSTNFDLFKVAIGGGESTNLSADNPAWDTQPVFSADGKSLAYLAMSRPGFEADRFRIMIRSWPDGQAREVAPEWDRSPGGLLFSADGKTLYATADDLGQHPLFAIDVASGAVTKVEGDGYVASPRLAGDQLVFARDDLRSPAELFRVKASGGDPEAITAINGARVAALKMGEPEQFSFAGWKKETVHGWVVKPVDFDEKKRYPVAFLIHGGPQGSFGNHFHYRWNPQVYAGAGYAVVMIDFHGSTGYGQRFTDSISGDWGGKPLDDLKLGLKHVTDAYPWLAEDRVCALGASYGGFMINWIAGQWSDRFRCLVNHDGVFDNRMMYYATDELWFAEWEQGGPYWKHEKEHERHNPVRFVERWKTPMLVIHGSLDYRIPETQGLGAFTALQRREIPSRLVIFPDENHWVLKPANSLQWHDEVLGWLDTWTGESK
ncbi:MAG: S9 family peptidase [Myxococcales bacterium]|nr:S9 family peptidase [Myxococcales bacterium]